MNWRRRVPEQALPILCAVLLTAEPVTTASVPDIVDVNKLIDLLRALGVQVERIADDTYRFTARTSTSSSSAGRVRQLGGACAATSLIAGRCWPRFGRGYIPSPGGDKIDRRRLDTLNLPAAGAGSNTTQKERFYRAEAKQLKGTYMLLDEPSVTGTANIVIAAVMAEGRTTIFAACEPTCSSSAACWWHGRQDEGIGSNLVIDRVKELGGTEHRMLPDMMVGSFIGMAAMTRSDSAIGDTGYDHLGVTPTCSAGWASPWCGRAMTSWCPSTTTTA